MTRLRRLVSRNAAAALLLALAALFMKAAVPAGFMPDVTGGSVRLVLCSGYGPETVTPMAMTMPASGDHHDSSGSDHKGAPCGFFGHAAGSMFMADPIVLAIAIAFILATAFRQSARIEAVAPPFLRPPLRGPPGR